MAKNLNANVIYHFTRDLVNNNPRFTTEDMFI